MDAHDSVASVNMTRPTSSDTRPDIEALAQHVGARINEQLLNVLRQLLSQDHFDNAAPIKLECSLLRGLTGSDGYTHVYKIASSDVTDVDTPIRVDTPVSTSPEPGRAFSLLHSERQSNIREEEDISPGKRRRAASKADEISTLAKRRATGGLRIGNGSTTGQLQGDSNSLTARRIESDSRVFPQRKKRVPGHPNFQPSSLAKFINSVWENIFSAIRLDPAEIIEQWQAIEHNGQPRLLLDADREVAPQQDTAVQRSFGRMNMLTRKISQASRTCRSLEIIVQAHWVSAFDDRVQELSATTTREKAKKMAISEACMDFDWTEKELRNKMAIWRGYHDIKNAGGWSLLVFAGFGLYRFCKYRVCFTEETFNILKAMRHRFEVAADCLHPRWRSLLAIVGASTERKFTGHVHDFVVCGADDEAIPLPITYQQWDVNFSYTHLDESIVDEDAWGLYDPRTVLPSSAQEASQCSVCRQRQSEDPRENDCVCFPNLYGSTKANPIPVQIFRTANGKNNGLLACCAFERAMAIGEFVGLITSGVQRKDVMCGQTDRATYQIWQGKEGNYTRFVNHSCQPNSQFERFIWLGTQRIVLVSKGIEAGEEITVDYSDTYWKDLDKECLCNSRQCRYRSRSRIQPATPTTNE